MATQKHTPRRCRSAGRVTAKPLFLWVAASFTIPAITAASWTDGWLNRANQAPIIAVPHPVTSEPQMPLSPSREEHDFMLRHIFEHGTYQNPDLYRRLDIKPGDVIWAAAGEQDEKTRLGTLHARSATTTIERLSDRRVSRMQSLYSLARLTGTSPTLDASEWTADEVRGPNVTDKETVVSLAKMAWNAYTAEPGTGEWQDETGRFNHSQGFGWEGDSLRGHIFADKDNSTIIINLKGTSPGKSKSPTKRCPMVLIAK